MRRRAPAAGPGLVAGLALLVGCGEPPPSPVPLPVVLRASISPGPANVLSAVMVVDLREADSALVRFGRAGEPLERATPAVAGPADSGEVEVPVLGLLAETPYRLVAAAYGPGGVTTGDTLQFTTGPLPVDLPAYFAGGADPTPGLVVFGAYPYGVVIDNTGRVVWYRHLDGGPTLNFQVQPTGRYTTSPIQPAPGDLTPWVEFDPLGRETRRLGCADGLVSRFHEMIAEADGGYWIMCDETRTMDLTPYGGQPAATVTGTVVQHVGAGGMLLFSWNAFDHFAITDLESSSRTGPAVNWTHGNALAFDGDGELLVSFRSLNEVTKIDTASGAVLWRFGGLASQFTLAATLNPFLGQHGLRMAGPGRLLLLDNRGIAGASRAEAYTLDEVHRTAVLTGTYAGTPSVIALLGGSTQVLPGGRVLVAYGNGNRLQEYDASGNVVWEIHGNPGYVFRAQRIRSLYTLELADSR